MPALNTKDIQEILKLFENELNVLVRTDKFEKMEIRKRIKDAIIPLTEMDIWQSSLLMDIIEEKLHDIINLFIDGYEFRKKLERKLIEQLKNKQH